jgi:hypothetical protein
MRSRFLWYALVSTAGLAVFACRSEPASREPQEHVVTTPKPHIVPLAVLGDRLAICREEKDKPLPSWARAAAGGFISVTRTRDELSIIVSDQRPPADAKCERDWRLIMVKGPLDFTQVGIIAGLSGTLASAGISIFALSTYDTDYIMVKQADLERALSALRQAGYPVSQLASS